MKKAGTTRYLMMGTECEATCWYLSGSSYTTIVSGTFPYSLHDKSLSLCYLTGVPLGQG